MSSFRGSLIAGLADLTPEQVLDVMGYIKSRARYLTLVQRRICLRAYDMACARLSLTGDGAEQARTAATGMLRARQALYWAEPLTQVIEGGRLQVGATRQPYDWNGPRLTVAGHQFLVRELLAAKLAPGSAPAARQTMPMQLDLFGVAA